MLIGCVPMWRNWLVARQRLRLSGAVAHLPPAECDAMAWRSPSCFMCDVWQLQTARAVEGNLLEHAEYRRLCFTCQRADSRENPPSVRMFVRAGRHFHPVSAAPCRGAARGHRITKHVPAGVRWTLTCPPWRATIALTIAPPDPALPQDRAPFSKPSAYTGRSISNDRYTPSTRLHRLS